MPAAKKTRAPQASSKQASTKTAAASSKYDLVLFGATGFTGTQTMLHLAQHVPAGLKWAIGGRNAAKLKALLALIPDCPNPPAIVIADSADSASVQKLVLQTRVLIQLAGPYSEHGELFVQACAQHGVHYLDLAGEIPWVQRMVHAHHEAAVHSGARIIPVCGFEALPYDLACLWAAQNLAANTGQRAQAIHIVTTMSGPRSLRPADLLSGGTTASILNMLAQTEGTAMTDPAALVADPNRAARVRQDNAYDLRAHYSAEYNAWLMPMIPAPFVNPPIIHRTASLLAHSRSKTINPLSNDYTYHEYLSAASFAPYKLAQAAAAQALARGFMAMQATVENSGAISNLKRTTASKFIATFGPKTGQGPREHMLEKTAYHLHVTASAGDGHQWQGTVHGQGHPGYRSTANIAAQVGLLLASNPSHLPDRAGVLTPASALGTSAHVLAALATAGLKFVG